jgi:hypothetical protein
MEVLQRCWQPDNKGGKRQKATEDPQPEHTPTRLCNQQPSQALHSQTNQSHEHWQAAPVRSRFCTYRLWRGPRRVIIRRGAWMAVRGW